MYCSHIKSRFFPLGSSPLVHGGPLLVCGGVRGLNLRLANPRHQVLRCALPICRGSSRGGVSSRRRSRRANCPCPCSNLRFFLPTASSSCPPCLALVRWRPMLVVLPLHLLPPKRTRRKNLAEGLLPQNKTSHTHPQMSDGPPWFNGDEPSGKNLDLMCEQYKNGP